MIFLHGAGERGSDLELVKRHGPPKLVEAGKDLPFIIVSPQCPSRLWWPSLTERVMALIDEVVEKKGDVFKVLRVNENLNRREFKGSASKSFTCHRARLNNFCLKNNAASI